jgi:hypothetical protein
VIYLAFDRLGGGARRLGAETASDLDADDDRGGSSGSSGSSESGESGESGVRAAEGPA